mmetsp:Transcript_44271/g.86626  ORF Transcript_44271/g.86626 Transcript_44271/m.86626 type:complete len:201 (-) Transcript_44271:38-640(-)
MLPLALRHLQSRPGHVAVVLLELFKLLAEDQVAGARSVCLVCLAGVLVGFVGCHWAVLPRCREQSTLGGGFGRGRGRGRLRNPFVFAVLHLFARREGRRLLLRLPELGGFGVGSERLEHGAGLGLDHRLLTSEHSGTAGRAPCPRERVLPVCIGLLLALHPHQLSCFSLQLPLLLLPLLQGLSLCSLAPFLLLADGTRSG